MQAEVAAKVSGQLSKIHSELRGIVQHLKDNCSEGEYRRYSRQLAIAMVTIGVDVLKPIWKEHPSLRPPGAE